MSWMPSKRALTKLRSKAYRDAYVGSFSRENIANQIRHLREQRDMTQAELAKESGKRQSQISRLENTSYGRLTLQSLLDLAAAFDVALLIRFLPLDEFLTQTRSLGPAYYEAPTSSSIVEELLADEPERIAARGTAPGVLVVAKSKTEVGEGSFIQVQTGGLLDILQGCGTNSYKNTLTLERPKDFVLQGQGGGDKSLELCVQ